MSEVSVHDSAVLCWHAYFAQFTALGAASHHPWILLVVLEVARLWLRPTALSMSTERTLNLPK